jgi:DNA-binding transcriptional MerR regulator
MSTQPVRGYLSISEVLAELRAEFPDISVSKIRFLETEGLIAPARSPSGYRRFSAGDVDRLRLVLAWQRDQYLPLRVIRERLAQLSQPGPVSPGVAPGGGHAGPVSSGAVPSGALSSGAVSSGAVSSGQRAVTQPVHMPRNGGPQRGAPDGQGAMLSRRDLVDAAGVSEALLTELETFGLIRRIGRQYAPEALEVARTAKALTSFGVEARHLRAVRAAAERETTMIESLVAPILRQRGPGARELAARTARDCAALVLRLHGALVEGTLAEAGFPAVGLGRVQPGEPESDAGPQAHGMEGASA